MEILSLKNVEFSYKDADDNLIKAVDDVSLSVREGEFVAVLGANGSGKSTLAKLIDVLLPPEGGIIEVFGLNTSDEKNLFDIRKSVGMVFQNPDNQMVASIVEDDVAFGPENIGVERGEIIERVEWALKAVDMLEHKTAAPFKLSGGQKQRVAIAGILALKPRIVIFDESTSMLDPKGRSEVMSVAKRLQKQDGMTVLFITHDMNEALDADRVIVLENGAVRLAGTPEEIFSSRDLEAYRLKPPLIPYIAEKLREGGLPIRANVMREEELTEELCRLL